MCILDSIKNTPKCGKAREHNELRVLLTQLQYVSADGHLQNSCVPVYPLPFEFWQVNPST